MTWQADKTFHKLASGISTFTRKHVSYIMDMMICNDAPQPTWNKVTFKIIIKSFFEKKFLNINFILIY